MRPRGARRERAAHARRERAAGLARFRCASHAFTASRASPETNSASPAAERRVSAACCARDAVAALDEARARGASRRGARGARPRARDTTRAPGGVRRERRERIARAPPARHLAPRPSPSGEGAAGARARGWPLFVPNETANNTLLLAFGAGGLLDRSVFAKNRASRLWANSLGRSRARRMGSHEATRGRIDGRLFARTRVGRFPRFFARAAHCRRALACVARRARAEPGVARAPSSLELGRPPDGALLRRPRRRPSPSRTLGRLVRRGVPIALCAPPRRARAAASARCDYVFHTTAGDVTVRAYRALARTARTASTRSRSAGTTTARRSTASCPGTSRSSASRARPSTSRRDHPRLAREGRRGRSSYPRRRTPRRCHRGLGPRRRQALALVQRLARRRSTGLANWNRTAEPS